MPAVEAFGNGFLVMIQELDVVFMVLQFVLRDALDGVDPDGRVPSPHFLKIFDYYNDDRPHQSLDYRTPAEVYFKNYLNWQIFLRTGAVKLG